MSLAGLEPATPTIERKRTYSLDRMATQGPHYVPTSQNTSVCPRLQEHSAILSAPTDDNNPHSWPCVVFPNITCYIQITFKFFTVTVPSYILPGCNRAKEKLV
jgi:hypothetical protein